MKFKIIIFVLWFSSKLPLRIVHIFGHIVGVMFYIFPNKLKKVSKINIDLCFSSRSTYDRRILLKKSLIEQGKAILELGPMWLWSTDKLLAKVKDIHGIEVLAAHLGQRQGVLLATPHFGSWELCGLIAASYYPLAAMYRPPKITALEPWILQARQRSGAKLVDYGARGLKAMRRSLQCGEVVGILPDQQPRQRGGVFVPFFGAPAYTMTLLSKMARKADAAVFFISAQRLPKGQGYQLKVRQAPPEIADENEVLATTALNQLIETIILDCPEQYLWSYRRFKRRPPGAKALY